MEGRRKYFVQFSAFISFAIFVMVDAQVARSSCKRMAKFENQKTGLKLANNILETVYVQQPTHCVMNCLRNPSCKSINYKATGNDENVCELNSKTDHDTTLTSDSEFVYYGPENVELDCSVSMGPGECINGGKCVLSCPDKGLYNCECPFGYVGATCNETQGYHLLFPRGSVEDYMSIESDLADTDTFTVLFWINTLSTTPVAPFSYGVGESNQELLVVLDVDKLILTVQNTSSRAFYLPPVNDGYWHQIGVVRNGLLYKIYVDGERVYAVDDLGTSAALKGNGVFVLGQKMNGPGSNFDGHFALKGKLRQFNMWSSVLGTSAIRTGSKTCVLDTADAVNWINLRRPLNGHVAIERSFNCETLRKNDEYDVIVSPSGATTVPAYAISPEETTSDITAFTITLWVKFTSLFPYYVSYATAFGSAFAFGTDESTMCAQLFMDGSSASADIPLFFQEDPPYWHHLGTSWSNSDAKWLIFLDGSMVSMVDNVFRDHIIPKGGKFVIGNEQTTLGSGMTLQSSFTADLSRVNIWDFVLDGRTISTMGTTYFMENGNLFAWFGIRTKSFGDLSIERRIADFYNRGAAHYALLFSSRTTANYVRIDDPFSEDVTSMGFCLWVNMNALPGFVLTYSTTWYSSEFEFAITGDMLLRFHIHHDQSNDGVTIDKPREWHFYCINWRNSDGKLEYYVDGFNVRSTTFRTGYVIKKGGVLLLGQKPDSFAGSFDVGQAMAGVVAQLNIWQTPLSPHVIKAMASGVMNINGDLVQWKAFKKHIVGSLTSYVTAGPVLPEYAAQKKRDAYCHGIHPGYFARNIPIPDEGYKWRCVTPNALTNNMIYDIKTTSSEIDSDHESVLRNMF